MIRDAITKLTKGNSLTEDESSYSMEEIMNGEATPAQFGSFVTAMHIKGETVDEIVGMARVMKQMALHVEAEGILVDTCGTGGDGSNTFNISTTSGFVAAGAGIKIAKHGNRAMSGSCGSADVLESLNVKIDLSPDGVKKCIDETGFGFMFAQRFHPSMKFAAGPRKEIGIRTIFNFLGPLTNPAGAERQVIGVSDKSMAGKMAEVLSRLGSIRALILRGDDGLDEITLSTNTQVWELQEGKVSQYTISPVDFGLDQQSIDPVRVNTVNESVSKLQNVLSGESGPEREIVLLNTAAALMVSGTTNSLRDGFEIAAESIDSGRAKSKLDSLVNLSNKLT
ncbi:MAG: anthranilate phosphoribosyltransferase [Chloroflexota bacterium]|nr:anthranilate phosphoribosyltransferase [Chloroflexota bacterium]